MRTATIPSTLQDFVYLNLWSDATPRCGSSARRLVRGGFSMVGDRQGLQPTALRKRYPAVRVLVDLVPAGKRYPMSISFRVFDDFAHDLTVMAAALEDGPAVNRARKPAQCPSAAYVHNASTDPGPITVTSHDPSIPGASRRKAGKAITIVSTQRRGAYYANAVDACAQKGVDESGLRTTPTITRAHLPNRKAKAIRNTARQESGKLLRQYGTTEPKEKQA
jgi:hypothetical protein